MKTAKQRQEEFMAEFHALMRKHKATFEVDTRSTGYYDCEPYCEISMPGEYDENHDTVAEWTCFKIDRYFNGERE